ncbi:MAG TPA: chemotaxis protein CheD [Actinobacteria bacterium]|nr:chemotaxis protein CheD [Actinomycetota bacterium]
MVKATTEELSISIGIGEMCVSKDKSMVFVAHGLGSCVGICMCDEIIGIGGMAHIMLPNDNGVETSVPVKFADTGIPKLMNELIEEGAKKNRMKVKIAGGANMLNLPGSSGQFDIGSRNVEMTKKILKDLGLNIASSDVGGNCGRTVYFYPSTGRVLVRTIGQQLGEI